MKSSIVEVQNKILELMKYFDNFCKQNGIVYYLMGGSALGAVRHKGFIPWDDDLDVFMTYDNYIKFIDACKNNLDTSKYYFQEENTEELPLFYSKLRMNGTTYIEKNIENRDMHKGIFIDIMCLNETSKFILIRFKQYVRAKMLSTKALVKNNYHTSKLFKRFFLWFCNWYVTENRAKKYLKYIRKFNGSNKKYVGHFFGRAKFKNTSFPIDCLGIPKYVEFSTIYLPVPQNVDKYLTIRYGKNYMDPPSQKIRDKYPAHAVYADVNMDYKNYEKTKEN